MTRWASAEPAELDAHASGAPRRRRSVRTDVLELQLGVDHRAVDAHAQVAAAAPRHGAAVAGAEAAGHAGLQRELRGHVARSRTSRARPRASAPGRRRRRPRASRAPAPWTSSSVTRPWWPTEPSSVATRAPCSSAAPCARAPSRKPSSTVTSPRRSASSASCRIASGAMPTPPPTRIARRRRRGRREAVAERAERPQPVALAQLAQAPRARADVLEQEVRLADAPAGDREGARQVRALVLSPAPALGGGEHRELPGLRLGRLDVGDAQHAVGAELVDAERRSAAGAANGAGAAAHSLTPSAPRRPRDAVQLLQAQHRGLAVAPRAGDRARGGHAGGRASSGRGCRASTAARRIS